MSPIAPVCLENSAFIKMLLEWLNGECTGKYLAWSKHSIVCLCNCILCFNYLNVCIFYIKSWVCPIRYAVDCMICPKSPLPLSLCLWLLEFSVPLLKHWDTHTHASPLLSMGHPCGFLQSIETREKWEYALRVSHVFTCSIIRIVRFSLKMYGDLFILTMECIYTILFIIYLK